ncbi:msl6356 [Mesorhizobium japonicum MAFF 303099]|uniref:Msl6356 protein n=1 Tax=Mesorhizobium japonicum (strain LMG 29417 / CECT 9101 / MAFF 303099) TaxID=266835 RepID=Q989M7_RHILO|nr:msl6356 [Mesorhizobium japonicum MAFF 303099]
MLSGMPPCRLLRTMMMAGATIDLLAGQAFLVAGFQIETRTARHHRSAAKRDPRSPGLRNLTNSARPNADRSL